MKVDRKTAVAVVFAAILAFLFLVPLVSYGIPPGTYHCPLNGCDFLRYGSVTYWAFGVGATWREARGYSIEVIGATTAAGSTTSSVSYTVTAEPTHAATSVTDTKNHLQLRLSLNASSAVNGVTVSVFVDEYNLLGSTNNVTAAHNWPLTISELDGAPCWRDDWPVGFAIASGQYTSANITTAKFLDLVDPGATYNCPLFLGYGHPIGFLFQPLNDTAASYGCVGVSPSCPTGSASTGRTPSSWGPVTGYWNQGGAFTSFPRGVYTVFAEDEWGNSVSAYFTVS